MESIGIMGMYVGMILGFYTQPDGEWAEFAADSPLHGSTAGDNGLCPCGRSSDFANKTAQP